jgi:ABC-type amino acid transport substrate-binding protein
MSLHHRGGRAELLGRLMGFAALICAGASASAQEQQPRPARAPLAVCLQTNDPPLSVRSGDGPRGFAVALSRAIAERLDRDLFVQWFVSRDDPDANLAKDANALLSDHRCQLLAEYPLVAGILVPLFSPTARMPPFDGAKPDDQRRWVELHEIIPSRPYRADALAVVLPSRDSDRRVRRLADLEGLKIGVQIATLADAIAMQYGDRQLDEHVVHVREAQDLFQRLESGTLDAAFAGVREYDAWRLRHPDSGIALSDYRHSLAFNMGYVALRSDEALIRQVDKALAELEAHGTITSLAASTGLTMMPPRMPDLQGDISPSALNGD